jgi:hypothetical protein
MVYETATQTETAPRLTLITPSLGGMGGEMPQIYPRILVKTRFFSCGVSY